MHNLKNRRFPSPTEDSCKHIIGTRHASAMIKGCDNPTCSAATCKSKQLVCADSSHVKGLPIDESCKKQFDNNGSKYLCKRKNLPLASVAPDGDHSLSEKPPDWGSELLISAKPDGTGDADCRARS